MLAGMNDTESSNTTSHQVVLPFYGYASLAYLAATLLLVFSSNAFTGHYFHPHILAITHIMALGWGTMMILGASYQLVPVLIERKLYSSGMAFASFLLAGSGIPLLCFGFYVFDMGRPAQWGGWLILFSIVVYLVNLAISMAKSKEENVHAFFVFTAALWLLATVVVGLLLVYNFTYPLLSKSSLDYLPVHAHLGIAGWFLLLIIGVGSRLIPMFLISKYTNPRLLWWVYGLINGGLLAFIGLFLYSTNRALLLLPILAIAAALVLFAIFCYRSYQQRIRKKVDEPMQISLLSVLMLFLPLAFLAGILLLIVFGPVNSTALVTAYGFVILFGWITAIILGMTFKTLPFIVWNKVYHLLAGKHKTPNPKDLFSERVFRWMGIAYLAGFILFCGGILAQNQIVLHAAAVLLLASSLLYNWNVIRLLLHKPALV